MAKTDVTLTADLTGINPFDPLQFEQMPQGAYKVKIEDYEVNDKGNILFTVRSYDEPAKGDTTGIMLGTNFTLKGNKSHYKALATGALQAAGQDPAGANRSLSVPVSAFVGKDAYIFVKHAPEGEVDEQGRKPFPNRNFVTKEFYEAQRKAMAANGPDRPATPGGFAAAAPAAPAAAPAPGLASLFGGAR